MKLLPPKIINQNFQLISGLERFLKFNQKPLAVICRPGLGAIFECLSSGIVPILLDNSTGDLASNFRVCIESNWAVSLVDFIQVSPDNQAAFLYDFYKKITFPKFMQSETFVKEYLGPAIGY